MQLWTCTLVSGTQTLFKQRRSETGAVRRRLFQPTCSRIIYGSDKQTKNSPRFYSWSPVPESRALHSGPVCTAGPLPVNPPFFSTCLLEIPHQGVRWSCDSPGATTEAPLCAEVHRPAGPTRHSWNLLVTAEWPPAARWLQNKTEGGGGAEFSRVSQQTLIPGWGSHCMSHF